MKKVFYNKLVRDGIPQYLESLGKAYEARSIVDAEEFDNELRKKVVEEALELQEARGAEAMGKELADLLEVVALLKQKHDISDEDIARFQHMRQAKKGGFEHGTFLLWSEDDGYEQLKRS